MRLFSVRLRKSLADVTRRKGRTLLVVVGIFIGVVGLTAVNFTEETLFAASMYQVGSQVPRPDIVLMVDRLDPALTPKLAAVPSVQTVQAQSIYLTQWHVSAAPGHINMALVSYPDLRHVPLTPFQLTSGRYPGAGEIIMEYGDLGLQSFHLGDLVTVDAPQGTVQMQVVGLTRTPGEDPAASGHALGFMSDAALNQAFGTSGTTGAPAPAGGNGPGKPTLQHWIDVKVGTRSQANATSNALIAVLQAHQVRVLDVHVVGPSVTPSQIDTANGVFTLLRILAVLAVVLSGILILNTVTTIIAEQTSIIGTMKAMGGTRGTILCSYLVSVSVYGVLGTVPGLALGLLGGYEVASYLATTIPIALGPVTVSLGVVALSLAVGFGVPLLAALVPLWNGTRISVREALAAYGVSGVRASQGRGLFGRAAQGLTWVSQTTWLGLRGLFRRRARAALTLLTLTLAGASFLVVQMTAAAINQED